MKPGKDTVTHFIATLTSFLDTLNDRILSTFPGYITALNESQLSDAQAEILETVAENIESIVELAKTRKNNGDQNVKSLREIGKTTIALLNDFKQSL